MKKLSFLLATLGVTLLAGFGSSGTAHAETGTGTCPIDFTGPNSQNVCTSEKHYTCTVNNDNKVTFINENNQVVGTGDAVVSDNTSGGSAITGTATNQNGTTFNATITNGNDCVVTATAAPIVTPASEQPVAPVTAPAGKGQVGPAATTATPGMGAVAAQQPQVLPNTAAASPLTAMGAILGSASAVLLLARLAVVAHGRFGA